jgi:hypothetical protein
VRSVINALCLSQKTNSLIVCFRKETAKNYQIVFSISIFLFFLLVYFFISCFPLFSNEFLSVFTIYVSLHSHISPFSQSISLSLCLSSGFSFLLSSLFLKFNVFDLLCLCFLATWCVYLSVILLYCIVDLFDQAHLT